MWFAREVILNFSCPKFKGKMVIMEHRAPVMQVGYEAEIKKKYTWSKC